MQMRYDRDGVRNLVPRDEVPLRGRDLDEEWDENYEDEVSDTLREEQEKRWHWQFMRDLSLRRKKEAEERLGTRLFFSAGGTDRSVEGGTRSDLLRQQLIAA